MTVAGLGFWPLGSKVPRAGDTGVCEVKAIFPPLFFLWPLLATSHLLVELESRPLLRHLRLNQETTTAERGVVDAEE